MKRPLFILALLLASGVIAAPKEWSNTTDTTTEITVAPAPVKPVVLETDPDKKPLRALPYSASANGITVRIPPHSSAQLWTRGELIGQTESPFGTAAQYGVYPHIAVGPLIVDQITDPARPTENPVWESAPGRFRAYPEGTLPVSVKVRNEGTVPLKNPRVRLFTPDTWKATPYLAQLITGQGKVVKSLPPGMAVMAVFSLKIPKQAALGSPSPLVAFLRFESAGKTVTVQNSISVTLEEPVERRYSMTEVGDKFNVRLINHFQPAELGRAVVEVRKPAGTNWEVTPPQPVLVKDAEDAKASISGLTMPNDQIGVPVVVTLNGYRMGYTPLAAVVAAYSVTPAAEKGLTRLPAGSSPFAMGPDGLCFADAPGADHALSLDVAPKFAVSDPTVYVSPSWVTVEILNKGATRIRLEYDAYGSDERTVAGDLPVTKPDGAQTFSFLLPDARFSGKLPAKADIRLVLSGGTACVRRVSVTKWNPLKN